MARRARAKRRRDDSDDEESEQTVQRDEPMDELPDMASVALESDVEDREAGAPTSKRAVANETEEAELARRRRRRQSLVFQKRRQSLTPSTKNLLGSGAAGSEDGEPPANRQYISDMYSTIIKMSSENKINIKNTWSLHLIDHMEDILAAPQVERPGVVEDPDTFNFQKASCTLDASIKIYSYRVDDTWTSSYKILENLSRSGGEKRADNEEGDEDDEDDEAGEDGEEGTQRKGKKKTSRKPASAAKTIEKNLNNITLKSYELDFEPDPLFHKMSQTFDEGGAKGMLLANLGVYDGAKILLNSADVHLTTRKPIERKAKKVDDEESTSAEEVPEVVPPKPERIDLSSLGKLSCFSKDVTSVAMCPPLSRLYEQIEELRDPTTTQPRIVLQNSVLKMQARRPKSPEEGAFVPATPMATDESFLAATASVDNNDEDAVMEDATEMAPIDEADGGYDHQDDDDGDDENNDPNDDPVEYGGGDDMDVEMEDVDAASCVSATDASASVDENAMNSSVVDADVDTNATTHADDNEPVTERHVDPVTNPRNEPKPVVVKSAADYFRAQMEDDSVKNEEDIAYSQMIETALMRSVILEAEGTESNDKSDYSYFDTKMMKNWAGPSHLKFKGTRRLPAAMLAFIDEQEEGASAAPAKRGRKPQAKKSSTLAGEKKSLFVDFLSSDLPDLAKLLKAPKASGSTCLTKLVVKRQMQKSAELVFPVDAHIESNIFFRHFLKPRLQLFHRRLQPSRAMEADDSLVPSASDPGLADADNLAYDDEDHGHDFGAGGFSDDDESDNEMDREGSTGFFSTANLITAERVVEKVDVHYERVAKRVDVKKLKTSLWSHLESETALLGKRKSRHSDTVEPEPEGSDDDGASSNNFEPTTFENVVQGIAGKVPSNVTVSFYFICMLHLANEKGLRLTGKDDLSDFAIKKEQPLARN